MTRSPPRRDARTAGIGQVRDVAPAAAGHARMVAAGLSLRHDCDYDPAVGCSSKDHPRDVEALRDALEALGLLPPRRRNTPEGRCPGCGRTQALTQDGRVAAHNGRDGDRCAGWRRLPERRGSP